MYFSRMLTARSLTVYLIRSACGGVHGMQAPLCYAHPPPCMPPARYAPRHTCPSCHVHPQPCMLPYHTCNPTHPLPCMPPATHAPLPCTTPCLAHPPPPCMPPHYACPPCHAHPCHACPPVDRTIDTRYLKHYLASNFVCGQ